METGFCLYHVEHLGRRQNGKETLVVLQLQFFHPQFVLIALQNCIAAGITRGRTEVTHALLLFEQNALLLLQLAEYWEEGFSLLWRECGLGGDELLQIGLKLAGVELLDTWLCRYCNHAHQEGASE